MCVDATMEAILHSSDIIQNVCLFLNARDYLAFQCVATSVSKNCAVGGFDDKYWSSKLIDMGIVESDEDTVVLAASLDPVRLFDDAPLKFNFKNPKKMYLSLNKCFDPYIKKLIINDDELTDFFFFTSDDVTVVLDQPEDKAKLLNNIHTFNLSNKNDILLFDRINNKLELLKKTVVETILIDMDQLYSLKDFQSINKFINILLLLKYDTKIYEFFNDRNPIDIDLSIIPSLIDYSIYLKNFLNEKIIIIDDIFKNDYPVISQYSKEIIKLILENFADNNTEKNNDLLLILPKLYYHLKNDFILTLNDSINDNNLKIDLLNFLNLSIMPLISNYLNTILPNSFKDIITDKLTNFKEKLEEDQKLLLSNELTNIHEKNNFKNNFLSSFKNMLIFKNHHSNDLDEIQSKTESENYFNIILSNMNSSINLELIVDIIKDTNEIFQDLLKFNNIDNELIKKDIDICRIKIFKILISQLFNIHIQPVFENALNLLQQYDYLNNENIQIIPLIKFTELINVTDIIIQMISIFYRNEFELLDNNNKDKNNNENIVDISTNNIFNIKKKFENIIDNYVANGLNIGMTKLMNEVEFILNTTPNDYNLKIDDTIIGNSTSIIRPSKGATKVIELLTNHCFLLNGATDKETISVYQQELGDRFFNEIVKQIKKNLISTDGSIYLICDINHYYEFIVNKLKQKNIIPLFIALKNISQIYIISTQDSKELAKIITDINKFNGIFTQEEIFEFVQRRSDWLKIKRVVEKEMYGINITDCNIM